MFTRKNIKVLFSIVAGAALLTSCFDPTQKADPTKITQSTGVEYAPQMYHSIPYDGLTQTVPNEKGRIADSTAMQDEGWMYKYNTNYFNPHNINMREPAPNTYRVIDTFDYGVVHYTPEECEKLGFSQDTSHKVAGEKYPTVPKNMYSIDSVFDNKTQSLVVSEKGEKQLKECKVLFERFCSHCHGKGGEGDGPVSKKLFGVANLLSSTIKTYPAGRVYHVITHGYGKMGAHNTQLSPLERWKIVTYVKHIQNSK